MINISLMVVPGTGHSMPSVSEGTTLGQFVFMHNLHDRSIIVNGQTVAPSDYAEFVLRDGHEVFAGIAVKGA
jgi:hypothetical protein